jgi:hypothetical protein
MQYPLQHVRHFIIDKNIFNSGCICLFTFSSFISICLWCSDCGTQGSYKLGILRINLVGSVTQIF